MPRSWYDKRSITQDNPRYELYMSIVADKKPYFMRYIYPNLMREYNSYIKTTNRNSLMEFGVTVEEMLAIPEEEKTDRQKEFAHYYKMKLPVGNGDCVMNRICRRFEKEFDGCVGRSNNSDTYDYTILRNESEYTQSQYRAIKSIIDTYNSKVKSFEDFSHYERIDEDDYYDGLSMIYEEFSSSCAKICPDIDVLCNIAIDACYKTNMGKKFVWKFSAQSIVNTLLKNNGNIINVPVLDENGDIEYSGKKFSVMRVGIEGDAQ